MDDLPAELEAIGREVVDAALEVHRTLGPGLLESVYEVCLRRELELRGCSVVKQLPLPVVFKDIRLEAGYRLDLLVDNAVVVEIKAVEALTASHEAQLLTYLKLSRRRLGYLINFNAALLKQGLRRKVSGPSFEPSRL